jgi:hypothetical protein
VARVLWHERTGALAKFEKFLVIFVDFWSIWSGLVPNHNYFSETEGLAATLLSTQGPCINLQQDQGVSHKFHRI